MKLIYWLVLTTLIVAMAALIVAYVGHAFIVVAIVVTYVSAVVGFLYQSAQALPANLIDLSIQKKSV